tara:strand:- start:196 stop:666 length:471 start_codon:yes stop_codon:yes gene_type:complete
MRTTPKNPTLMLLISMLICISSAILLATVSIDTRDVVYPLTIGVTFVVMTYSIINAIFMAVAQYRYAKGVDAYPESKRIRLTSTMYRQATHGLLAASIILLYGILLTVLKGAGAFLADDVIVLCMMLAVSLIVSSLMHECARWMPDQPEGSTGKQS